MRSRRFGKANGATDYAFNTGAHIDVRAMADGGIYAFEPIGR
jgi:hypothetical protein